MKFSFKRLKAGILLGMLLLAVALPTQAGKRQKAEKEFDPTPVKDAGIFSGITKSCYEQGACTLCDILVVFINIANGILAVLAGLAAVFFVYGAGYLMLSQGSEDRINKGKTIIRAVIVGTVITLLAWQIMSVVVSVMANRTLQADNQVNPVFGWYQVAESCEASEATPTEMGQEGFFDF